MKAIQNKKHGGKKGIILIDAILAFALATIFIVTISSMSLSARNIFESAKIRLASPSISSTSPTLASLYSDLSNYAGTPLCSSDFMQNFASKNNVETLMHQKITSISLPINPLLPLTDIQVRNGIAYVSANSTVAADPDLLISNFKDREHPLLISSINTGPGISSISLAGNMIYAAADSSSAQLHVIRLDDLGGIGEPTSLTLEKKYKLPLPQSSTTPSRGSSIFFNNKNLYLGTDKWDGDEFSVLNVADPLNPSKIGGFETGSKINDILVDDSRGFNVVSTAYIADSDQMQFRSLELPMLTGSFSPSGWSRQVGSVISIFNEDLVLGRTSGGFNISTDHELFYFASSSRPSNGHIFDASTYSSVDIPGGVYGIVQDQSHVYVATRQVNKEFQVFTKSTSTALTLIAATSLPVAPVKMTCDGDYIYILAGTAPVIYEISYE